LRLENRKRHKYKPPEPLEKNENANDYQVKVIEWMLKEPKPQEIVKRRKAVPYWISYPVTDILGKEIKLGKLDTLEKALDRLVHLKTLADTLANKEDEATKRAKDKKGYRNIIRQLYLKLTLIKKVHTKLVNEEVETKLKSLFKLGSKKELTKKWKDTKILEIRNLITQTKKKAKNLKLFAKTSKADPNKVKQEQIKPANPKEK